MNASEFPPGGLKLLQGAVQSFLLSDSLQRLVHLVRWKAIVSCRENIKFKIAMCPIGYAGNMYELPKQNMKF